MVVTDRRLLDKQLTDTVKQFVHIKSAVGHADDAAGLRRLIEAGKSVILTTVQKLPFVVDAVGDAHRGRRFAVLIDEAHSSQGGKAAGALNQALGTDAGGDVDPDDADHAALSARIAARNCRRTPASSPSPPRQRKGRWSCSGWSSRRTPTASGSTGRSTSTP